MDGIKLISFIIALSAGLAFINIRYLKLPSTIGVMVLSLLFSLILLIAGNSSSVGGFVKDTMSQIDFSGFLLDFMLGFLLFAGALHTDVKKLRKAKWPILTYATVGTLISTFLVAGGIYLLLPFLY